MTPLHHYRQIFWSTFNPILTLVFISLLRFMFPDFFFFLFHEGVCTRERGHFHIPYMSLLISLAYLDFIAGFADIHRHEAALPPIKNALFKIQTLTWKRAINLKRNFFIFSCQCRINISGLRRLLDNFDHRLIEVVPSGDTFISATFELFRFPSVPIH